VTGWGQVRAEKQAVEGKAHMVATSMYEREIRLCFVVRRVSHWMVELKLLFFRWLSPFLKLV
jgi:hypothetical protein